MTDTDGFTGALPNRDFMPRETDALEYTLMRVPPTSDEQRADAAAFVASRARALDWSRARHEEVLRFLFAPPRPLLAHHKRVALAAEAAREQP